MSATELAAMIRSRKLSPVEIVKTILHRIENLNPQINAYCTIIGDEALAAAKSAERAVMRGEPLGPLHGVPVSIKDLIITKGIRTTWGLKVYKDFVPEEDAPVVERLKKAGAIVLGKTNTSALGWKAVTDNLLFGTTRNPWNPSLTPGGSSGGASAAVAAGLGPVAIATDGGGSIRIPASFTGTFGLKPSLGRIPAYPPSPNETLFTLGPICRTVLDGALILDVLAGPDERDRQSLPVQNIDYVEAIEERIGEMRIAWSPSLGYAVVDPEVLDVTKKAVRIFDAPGIYIEEADPGFENPESIWEMMFTTALAAKLADYLPEWRDQIDPGLVRAVEGKKALPATHLMRGFFKRAEIWEKVRRFYQKYDLLLTPTVAVPPFQLGLDSPPEIGGQRVTPLAWMAFAYPFNLTGQPCASIPCGSTKQGLPIGLQIVGRRFDEATVLKAAAFFETAKPWSGRLAGSLLSS